MRSAALRPAARRRDGSGWAVLPSADLGRLLAQALGDRHRGVGFDQLAEILPGENGADVGANAGVIVGASAGVSVGASADASSGAGASVGAGAGAWAGTVFWSCF